MGEAQELGVLGTDPENPREGPGAWSSGDRPKMHLPSRPESSLHKPGGVGHPHRVLPSFLPDPAESPASVTVLRPTVDVVPQQRAVGRETSAKWSLIFNLEPRTVFIPMATCCHGAGMGRG